ncbi:hypothetical protein HZS_7936 [Henneguya salminicola]|nr:hypothetical protein HZS_7936 [Henneguya salminicola]
MAMRHSRVLVFLGAASALLIMTILSACLGSLSTIIFPPKLCSIISCFVMYAFGFKMLVEAIKMNPRHAEQEINEVNQEIQKRNDVITKPINCKCNAARNNNFCKFCYQFMLTPFFQTLTMVFIGEWGDRSQLSTIVLATHKSIILVSSGAFLGHCMCTGLAVVGGSLLSQTVSVKTSYTF